MRRLITICTLAVLILAVSPAAQADIPLTWVFSPNSNQSGEPTTAVGWVGSTLTIGTTTLEPPPANQQPNGIFGAGAALPTGYTQFEISFDWEFNTWDSYNTNVSDGHTGYWDSFSATITKGGYYWNQALTDPINGDVEQILLLEAGISYDDDDLETYSGPWTTFVFNPPDGDQYYLNLVIDTLTDPFLDENYPSWGEFSDVSVVPVPGAILLGILGLSVAGLKLRKFS